MFFRVVSYVAHSVHSLSAWWAATADDRIPLRCLGFNFSFLLTLQIYRYNLTPDLSMLLLAGFIGSPCAGAT